MRCSKVDFWCRRVQVKYYIQFSIYIPKNDNHIFLVPPTRVFLRRDGLCSSPCHLARTLRPQERPAHADHQRHQGRPHRARRIDHASTKHKISCKYF